MLRFFDGFLPRRQLQLLLLLVARFPGDLGSGADRDLSIVHGRDEFRSPALNNFSGLAGGLSVTKPRKTGGFIAINSKILRLIGFPVVAMREFMDRLLDCDTLARRESLSDLILVKRAGYDRGHFDKARFDIVPL